MFFRQLGNKLVRTISFRGLCLRHKLLCLPSDVPQQQRMLQRTQSSKLIAAKPLAAIAVCVLKVGHRSLALRLVKSFKYMTL